jgi:4-amino-4-deoxy-L-arabinose transferase-like glycosyltransferase
MPTANCRLRNPRYRDKTNMGTINSRVKGTDLAILALIVVACSIPFLAQPFHMDDGFYLDMARNAQTHPFFPNDTPYVFQGIQWPDMGSHSHPLLQTYFLAAIMHFFGEGPGTECIYHLLALLYPILAVLSFHFIGARYLDRPLWPAALLACAPLFLVMQHTLMADVPMLAFWLAAIAFFLYATDQRKAGLYAASAIFLAAAMFTGYQSFALIPLLGFYHFRNKGGWRGWVALIIPLAAIGSWYFISCIHYKRLLWGFTLGYVQSRQPLSLSTLGIKLLSILEYQGWLIIFPFFVLCVLARHLKWRALLLAVLGATFLAQMRIPDYRLSDKLIFVIGFAAGLFIIFEMGKVAWNAIILRRSTPGFDNTDEQFLGLWYFGMLVFCLFILTEGSARYILPMVPPFLICYFRKLEIAEVTEYRLPARFLNSAMLASGSLVISLVWGLALSHADLELARIYPRAAKEMSALASASDSYSVGEWGFRYYLGRMGTKPLPADESSVRGGSYIWIPKLAVPHDIPACLRSMMIPVATFASGVKTPLRVFDWQTPAGFYSSGWGLIPFTFSKKALESIDIFQVNFMVDRLPQAQIAAESGVAPWPEDIRIEGKSMLAVLAKPGTRIAYPLNPGKRIRLELMCGVSSDSYQQGSDISYNFEVRQIEADGRILAEWRAALQPGINSRDRNWQPIEMKLSPTQKGTLEFSYSSNGKDVRGTGAFARSLLGFWEKQNAKQ